jgi:DNA gyrase, A subunit
MLSHPKFKEIIGRIHDECKDKQSTIQFLMEYFKISDLQAERISSMQLYNLNKTHIIKYQDEKDLLEKDIKDLIALRKNPKDIDLMIISELKVAQEKYGRPRQSRVLTTEEADNIVPEIEMSIAVYKDGTVRTSEDVDRIKHYKADKLVGVIDGVSRKDDIHLFTSSGNMLRVPVEKISDNANLKDQLGLHSNDSIVFACNINRLIENDFKYLVFITKDGLIKKSEINLYAAIKNTALMSIVLNDKDTVVQVIACRDNEPKYLLYSENGDCLIINVNTINTVGRMAKGVIGLALEGKDKLKDIVELTKYDSHLVIITEKGHIKKVSVETLPFNDRNGKTSSLATLLKGDKINNVLPIDSSEDRELTVTTNKNTYTIPYKDIPELTRKSKCEKVFNIGSTEYVVEMY